MVLIETLAWSIGAGPVSAQTVRVWRTCPESINGDCVGGWNDTHVPSLVVLGAVCLVAGVILVAVHLLLRRRFSDLELMPRLLDVGAQLSLATLGAVLLIGGAREARSTPAGGGCRSGSPSGSPVSAPHSSCIDRTRADRSAPGASHRAALRNRCG